MKWRDEHQNDRHNTYYGTAISLCFGTSNIENIYNYLTKRYNWDGQERWMKYIDDTGKIVVAKIVGELIANDDDSVCVNKITATGETQQVTIRSYMPLDTSTNGVVLYSSKTNECICGSIVYMIGTYGGGNNNSETAKGVTLSTSNGNIKDIEKYLWLAYDKDYYVEPFFVMYKDVPSKVYRVEYARITQLEREKDGRLICNRFRRS